MEIFDLVYIFNWSEVWGYSSFLADLSRGQYDNK